MIKNILIFSVLAMGSCLAVAAKVPATAKAESAQFCLYSKKNINSQCQKQSITMPMAVIIHDKKWAKVGLRDKEGTVGWVNIAQYQQAQRQFDQPTIQTVYVSRSKDKEGKSTYNIVAYKNGKPVSKAEAKKLYQQMRKNQRREVRGMDHLSWMMNRMFSREMQGMNQLMGDTFPDFQPIDKKHTLDLKGSLDS